MCQLWQLHQRLHVSKKLFILEPTDAVAVVSAIFGDSMKKIFKPEPVYSVAVVSATF